MYFLLFCPVPPEEKIKMRRAQAKSVINNQLNNLRRARSQIVGKAPVRKGRNDSQNGYRDCDLDWKTPDPKSAKYRRGGPPNRY